MNQNIKCFLRLNVSADTRAVNRLLVSTFIITNRLNNSNSFIESYIIKPNFDSEEQTALSNFVKLISNTSESLTLENLIELFEFVISPSDKEVNGAVYTPLYIREYIVEETLKRYSDEDLLNLKIGDLSCGCGGFFITTALYIQRRTGASISSLLHNFYGVDIAPYSIERTRILLHLLCLINGEEVKELPNLFEANSLGLDLLSIESIQQNGGLDIVIGNPPYVSASKISEESKNLLSRWTVASTGKTDLYLPFFQLALESLRPGGILGYITVNNFYRSLNGRAFRRYMSENKFNLQMIDFGSEQVFKGRSTYTCICFISKKEGQILYCQKKSSEIYALTNRDFISISYADVNDYIGWTLCDVTVKRNIQKIETVGSPLGKLYNIKNGFATLKNEVYVFKPIRESKQYFYLKYRDSEYKIEKSICKRAIKPNILKKDYDIEKNLEYLIFPYYFNENNQACLIDEETMQCKYPFALKYLHAQYDTLKKRDKGTREYPAWYAFGRTQALNIGGKKLLFPYLADNPYFVLSDDSNLLFYNGYAIVNDSIYELRVLQRLLQSSVFWYYIKNTSKPYGGEYFALAKNYIKNFGIPNLSKKEKDYLLNLPIEKVDAHIEELYGVTLK